MKLIIQIPCFNEEPYLATTIASLPRQIDGIDEIEVLVVDDGSQDQSARAARSAGARVYSLGEHRGLATAFRAGLQEGLTLGADIIVNTDADNQYEAADIEDLVRPIVAGTADLVVGDREVEREEFFSPLKRRLQSVGSRVVSAAAGVKVPDATSGFRAFSRTAAARVVITSRFSYTLETLIQAGALKERIAFVPVRTNAPVRPSRLMRSMVEYVLRSTFIISRSFALYHPFKTLFLLTGLACALALAGFAFDTDEILALAAMLQALTLLGFAPVYWGHRGLMKQVEEQTSIFARPAITECAAEENG